MMLSKQAPSPEIRTALGFSTAQLARALNRGFEGYVVPLRVTPAVFDERFRQVGLARDRSLVAVQRGVPVGVQLMAARGWTSYVAAMGVAPALRGSGLARRMMERAIADSRARGERRMVLEVIEQNPRAIRFYRKLGFEATRRLFGYRRGPARGARAELTPVDLVEFARVAARYGDPDPGWMLAPDTLAGLGKAHRAHRLDRCAWGLTAEAHGTAYLRGLVVPPRLRRRGHGRRLLEALFALHAGLPWVVSPIVPEGLGAEFLRASGFRREQLRQLEMELDPRR